MAVDATEVQATAARVRRQTNNRDVLLMCDAILAGGLKPQLQQTLAQFTKALSECPTCVARRKANTEAQRRWRAKG